MEVIVVVSQKSYQDNTGHLYLIPTPIGNLDDMTMRALKTLEMVDFLLCEDTRVTEQLLSHFHLRKKLYSCHDHNEDDMKQFVLEKLEEHKEIGLVTDRGTPIISDPGYKIVEEVIKHHFPVIGLPGPTAFVPALITSGLAPSPFLFYGFLNAKKTKREKELSSLKHYPYTMIFYEAPHRVYETLQSVLSVLGNRKISLHREISKLYEEVYRGTIEEVLPLVPTMKGEMVFLVDGNHDTIDYSHLSVKEHVVLYTSSGMSDMEAIKEVARERHVPKATIYQEYHRGK